MVVTCPRCLTKFNFTDESQTFGAEINFRCCRCQEEFAAVFQESAATLTDAIVSLSETGPDELSLPEDADSPADVAEIDLEEDFTSFSESSVETSESGLELDVDELFPEDDSPVSVNDSAGDTTEVTETTVSVGFGGSENEELTSDSDTIDVDDVESPVIHEGSDAAAVDEKTESSDQDNDQVAAAELEYDPEQPPATAARSRKNSPLLFICAVLILGMVFLIGSSLWQQFSLDMEKYLQLVEVSNQRLRLASDREIVILKGKVVNTSPKTVTDLKIKGVLLDSNGKVVAEVVTGGGVSFSLDELDRLDGSKLAMLEKIGHDLPPDGGELPFMLVFYESPDDAGKCYVEISSFKVK